MTLTRCLQCLTTYPVEVGTWENPKEEDIPDNSLMAPYCRGLCKRCQKEVAAASERTEEQPAPMSVATFSAANRQDPLAGYPGNRTELPDLELSAGTPLHDLIMQHHAYVSRYGHGGGHIEPLLTIDEGALRKTINYYFLHASVVEAMVVALQHMQISVCTMRGFSGKQGLACYRKNIICFPHPTRIVGTSPAS